MNGCACSFVRASAVRMRTVQYPDGARAWAAYSLQGGVYGQNLTWRLSALFCVCMCGTVFGLDSASSVSCMYTCVFMAVGMCSPSVVPLIVSTGMRALYSIWPGRPGRRAVFMSVCACTYILCLYRLHSVFGIDSSGNVPILPACVLYMSALVLARLYCACIACTVWH